MQFQLLKYGLRDMLYALPILLLKEEKKKDIFHYKMYHNIVQKSRSAKRKNDPTVVYTARTVYYNVKLVQRVVVCYKCKIYVYKRILRKLPGTVRAKEKKQFFIGDFLFRRQKNIHQFYGCIEIDGRRKSIRKKNTKKFFTDFQRTT